MFWWHAMLLQREDHLILSCPGTFKVHKHAKLQLYPNLFTAEHYYATLV